MSWTKLDDTLHGNSKVRRAGDAMSLWVVSLSFVGAQLTDGFVPEWFVLSWPHGEKHADKLVKVGLWHPAERDDETGWEFHDYLEYNPSRVAVRAQAQSRKERKERYLSRKAKGDLS